MTHENLFYGIRTLDTDGIEKAISRLEGEFFAKPYQEFVLVKNFSKTSYDTKKWFLCVFSIPNDAN